MEMKITCPSPSDNEEMVMDLLMKEIRVFRIQSVKIPLWTYVQTETLEEQNVQR